MCEVESNNLLNPRGTFENTMWCLFQNLNLLGIKHNSMIKLKTQIRVCQTVPGVLLTSIGQARAKIHPFHLLISQIGSRFISRFSLIEIHAALNGCSGHSHRLLLPLFYLTGTFSLFCLGNSRSVEIRT
ncbi:hypothetical protein S83_034665 [Arachis hypogaea]